MQQILHGYENIGKALFEVSSKRHMLVCDLSYPHLPIKDYYTPTVIFNQFTPNPKYEDVCNGVTAFNANNCDAIVAIGGGSTIDVAKCIKLFCKMDTSCNYLNQEPSDSKIPLIAVPSTAGTGSESTRYAVIYFDGKKQSIAHNSTVPNYAILEPALLKTLPLYQKKCTMLDALCQGIESMWSINSTNESLEYSKIAIQKIINYWQDYIENTTEESANEIMRAANYAGRAINITQTTAPHAMSYKLTSMYGIPHGYAVALCLPDVWEYMIEHSNLCKDARGEAHLLFVFNSISKTMGCDSPKQGLELFRAIMTSLDLPSHHSLFHESDAELLAAAVNPTRLNNSPVPLTHDIIRRIYNKILK